MKFIVFLVAIASALPLAILLRSSPRLMSLAWVGLGFLPFLLPGLRRLQFALINTEGWVGYVHGLEVALNDILALALLFALPRSRNVLNFHVPLLAYMLALVAALFQASHTLEASYNVFQFARMYLMVVVVARGCVMDKVPLLILQGMAIGIVLEFVVVVIQTFLLRYIQPPGTYAHQNTLGLVLHLVALPHFALYLGGARGIRYIAVPVLCLAIASLTASRASFGLGLAGLAIVYAGSILRGISTRKLYAGVLGVVAVLAVLPLAMMSFERRYAVAPPAEDVYDERAAFNRAAAMIVADHPMGVGPNHYVYVAKNLGYSIRAGVAPNDNNLRSFVHNAYLLAAAETGYVGLAALLLLMGYPLVVAVRFAKSAGPRQAGDLLTGSASALLLVYVHSNYEWIFFGADVQYVFALTIGTIFGVASRVARLGHVAPEEFMWRKIRPATG